MQIIRPGGALWRCAKLTGVGISARAVAACSKCGFTAEGRFRDTLFRDGTRHDALSMAIRPANVYPLM